MCDRFARFRRKKKCYQQHYIQHKRPMHWCSFHTYKHINIYKYVDIYLYGNQQFVRSYNIVQMNTRTFISSCVLAYRIRTEMSFHSVGTQQSAMRCICFYFLLKQYLLGSLIIAVHSYCRAATILQPRVHILLFLHFCIHLSCDGSQYVNVWMPLYSLSRTGSLIVWPKEILQTSNEWCYVGAQSTT